MDEHTARAAEGLRWLAGQVAWERRLAELRGDTAAPALDTAAAVERAA